MKCSDYDPDAYGCMSPLVFGRCPNVSEKRCSNGWLPFWTPAERAGLKAMGEYLHQEQRDGFFIDGELRPEEIICSYVRAARKTKED